MSYVLRTCALWLLLALASGPAMAQRVYDITKFGAKPDDTTPATAAIQQAIDQAASEGGGTVRLPAGKWLSGLLVLRSKVTIELAEGCTLQGSRNPDDYVAPAAAAQHPGTREKVASALIVGANLEQIGIRGPGTIDGSGDAFRDKTKRRPKAVMLVGCRQVLIEGVRMQAAGSWMQHYRDCDDLTIRNITVFNHASFNNDGLDIDSCRNVTITGCQIDSDDDGIVLKSLSKKPCENITVRDCTVSSHCNALKMGTESGGGFRQITFADCKVTSPRHSQVIYGKQRGLAGVALEIVDGGTMDGITVNNIDIDGVTAPIFLRLGNRARIYGGDGTKPGVGTLKNVVIRNVRARHASPTGCAIAGLPGHYIENVLLEDIDLSFDGGEAAAAPGATVRERPEAYPECTMFGTLPAYGFYVRHAQQIRWRNLTLRTEKADLRHALVLDDVRDASIDHLAAAQADNAAALVRLVDCQKVQLAGVDTSKLTGTLLSVAGKASQAIELSKTDVARLAKPLELGDGLPADTVTIARP